MSHGEGDAECHRGKRLPHESPVHMSSTLRLLAMCRGDRAGRDVSVGTELSVNVMWGRGARASQMVPEAGWAPSAADMLFGVCPVLFTLGGQLAVLVSKGARQRGGAAARLTPAHILSAGGGDRWQELSSCLGQRRKWILGHHRRLGVRGRRERRALHAIPDEMRGRGRCPSCCDYDGPEYPSTEEEADEALRRYNECEYNLEEGIDSSMQEIARMRSLCECIGLANAKQSTVRALKAVLMQAANPDRFDTDQQCWEATEASRSNFKKIKGDVRDMLLRAAAVFEKVCIELTKEAEARGRSPACCDRDGPEMDSGSMGADATQLPAARKVCHRGQGAARRHRIERRRRRRSGRGECLEECRSTAAATLHTSGMTGRADDSLVASSNCTLRKGCHRGKGAVARHRKQRRQKRGRTVGTAMEESCYAASAGRPLGEAEAQTLNLEACKEQLACMLQGVPGMAGEYARSAQANEAALRVGTVVSFRPIPPALPEVSSLDRVPLFDVRGSRVPARMVFFDEARKHAMVSGTRLFSYRVRAMVCALTAWDERNLGETEESTQRPAEKARKAEAVRSVVAGALQKVMTRNMAASQVDFGSANCLSCESDEEKSEEHPSEVSSRRNQGMKASERGTRVPERISPTCPLPCFHGLLGAAVAGSALSCTSSAACHGCAQETQKKGEAHEGATLIQYAWRTHAARGRVSWWDEKCSRKLGPLEAHVRFLQHVLRAHARGSRRGKGRVWRRPMHRCGGGENLATDEEFESQKQRAERMLQWYELYVTILRRVRSGVDPMVLSSFCGGGGSSEGVRRSGGVSVGLDNELQADYKRKFGDQTFVQGDATSWSQIGDLCKRYDFVGAIGSPPCKWYSRAKGKKESRSPPLIPATRNVMKSFFDYWAMENVIGARSHMSDSAVELFGEFFGLKVDRARLIESSFEIHVDECVRAPAAALRVRACLGKRRRWRRVDEFGRPEAPCCEGNIYAVQGTSPWKCTQQECAAAMGVDKDHMSYERLAQALPPSYVRLVWSQMCMRIAADKFGVPAITFDDHERDPVAAKRRLEGWLRGAGDDRPEAGMSFAKGGAPGEVTESKGGVGQHRPDSVAREEPSSQESRFREIFYSHVGGFDRQHGAVDAAWLRELKPSTELAEGQLVKEWLVGHNTYVRLTATAAKRLVPKVMQAVEGAGAGTRVTFDVPLKHEHWLRRIGGQRLIATGTECTEGSTRVLVSFGKRGHGTKESWLDHDRCRAYMDPRDCGLKTAAEAEKRERAWRPVWWEPEFWRQKGLPKEVERVMTEGAEVEFERSLAAGSFPQYPFESAEARYEASVEADRAVATGHMEYVPLEQIEDVLAQGVVHPWTMDLKGSKWRACQDYSRGTNLAARSAPFVLPTAWDAQRIIVPGRSCFAKYDLRDGFWAVPVSEPSRNRLVMRHPATGKLMRCARLPFGYVDSPRLFCSVTEAIAQEFRKRSADRPQGKGCHILCFVDDYLLVGDDEESTRWGGNLLEEIFHEFGIEFAPTKQRGPCKCIEFLGLLIANFEEVCCIGLSESRQKKVRDLIDEWIEQRPANGKARLVEPKPLAKLLGLLVFASQVVPGGRTYMQGMLAQFKGLEVDWRRGLVKPTKGAQWSQVEVTDSFWRDLEWWSECFETRNCTSLVKERKAEAAITGTDASDWGTGQLAWIDGGLDECVLRFGSAEKRRSINWRELLGVTRVVEQYGEQLRGRKVLLETDNTSAKGAAEKLFSKSEDMQELVRRLLEAAVRFDLDVRLTHTPGAKLDRPDQTSRGDPVSEPRVRLKRDEYELLSSRYGPFTDVMGAERQHKISANGDSTGPRVWMHPTFNSVGSALRLLGSRIMAPDGERARGIVVVPDHREAQWTSLLKHFDVVGRFPEGDQHLEMSQWGEWRPVTSRRQTLILSFPRSAGSQVRPVRINQSEANGDQLKGRRPSGYKETPAVGGWHLPIMKGSMLYSPAPVPGRTGELLIAWESFNPHGEEQLTDGQVDLRMAELVNVMQHGNVGGKPRRSSEYAVSNKIVKDKWGTRPLSFSKLGSVPWRVDGGLLWTVDHLVKEREPSWKFTPAKADAGQAAQWARKSFSFDFEEAERQIAAAQGRLSEVLALEEHTPATLARMAESLLLKDSEGPPSSGQDEESGGAVKAAVKEIEQKRASEDLEKARVSAVEAAAARKHKDPFEHKEPTTAPTKVEASPSHIHRCRYPGMPCAGCGREFEIGDAIEPAGEGMACSNGRCVVLAKQNLYRAVQERRDARQRVGDASLQSSKREAQLAHRFSDSRLAMVMKCLDGRCMVHGKARVMCRGAKGPDGVRLPCGRGLHALECAKVSSYHAQSGIMICVECRAKEMAPDCLGEEEVLQRSACRSMLVELACGAASTSKNIADFERLEREWMAEMTLDSPPSVVLSLREPRHSVESFIAFALWVVTTAGRARSFAIIIRMAGVAMLRMEIPDLTSNPRVKQVIKEVAEQIGVEPEPCDIPSTLVVTTMLNEVLPDVCKASECIYARSLVLYDGETAGGARVGEMAGAGDRHGVLANNSDIAVVLSGESKGVETVNLHVEDSKTKFSRDMTYMGNTQGKLALRGADNLRRLWRASGFKIVEEDRDGLHYWRPDFWVMRVSLVDMGEAKHKRLIKLLENTEDRFIKDNRSWILKYAKQRYVSKTFSEEWRYVNIAGGEKNGQWYKEAKDWLARYGYEAFGRQTEGPLLRASVEGSPKRLTMMPLAVGSSYTHVPTALTKAWKLNVERGVVDTELDLLGDKPKFGNHGNRRKADKIAMDTRDITLCTEEDIDDHFGWDQAERKKKSQLHYKGRSDRMKRARVTMML